MSKNNKSVSIVLCTYNGSSYLKKQIDSVLSQKYEISEIIVVDDCSTDETRDILKNYEDEFNEIKCFFNVVNIGPAKSFQLGISLATGSYIALCDQDDIWLENKISLQMDMILKSDICDTKPLLVYHDLCLVDQDENLLHPSFWALHKFDPSKLVFSDFFINNVVTGCTCLINVKMKEELLKCDMEFIIMHDHLLALIGYGFGDVIYIKESLMKYRSHSKSVTDKQNSSIILRFKNLFSKLKNHTFLKANILQIEEFNKCYGKQVFDNDKYKMNEFIALGAKNSVSALFYKILK